MSNDNSIVNNEQKKKADLLRERGIELYPKAEDLPLAPLSIMSHLRSYNQLSLHEDIGSTRVFGRVMFKNELGKIGFARIEDSAGKVQICVSKNSVSEDDFFLWKKLDVGDLIYVTGTYGRTRTGELTIFATGLSLATKCVSPMPDKISGISDSETQYRQRYLDLLTSEETRNRFAARSAVVSFIRSFFGARGFMEVETPMLHSKAGGAMAKPFKTHHNSLDQEMYLRIAPELELKKLLVGGFSKIFELNKCFRNEGLSTRHNPEFTTIEFYEAHKNYRNFISLISDFLVLLSEADGVLSSYISESGVNLANITVVRFDDLIRNLGIDDPWDMDQLKLFWLANNKDPEGLPDNISDWFDLIFDKFIQPKLIDPTFVTNHPAEMSPLARRTDGDPRTADRFELYIRGMEISDGWTELNDPVLQAEILMEQSRKKESGNEEAMGYDEDFINALCYGMPPSAGAGIGIDRLLMVLLNRASIKDVILFPTLRQ